MFFRGLVDAGMIWLQQSMAADSQGYLDADSFSADFYIAWRHHGLFRDDGIFLRAHELDCAASNWRARSGFSFLKFPRILAYRRGRNADQCVLCHRRRILRIRVGWRLLRLSELEFNPGVGVDYLIWSLQLSGLGSLLAGINFFVTIIKKRAPGMTLMKMPLFVWTSLCGMILIISAFPVLTATTLLLWLDRFLDMHFFTVGLAEIK